MLTEKIFTRHVRNGVLSYGHSPEAALSPRWPHTQYTQMTHGAGNYIHLLKDHIGHLSYE